MLTLAAGDTIAGVASAATQLTLTLLGMERNGTTQVYKTLFQGQLPSSVATQYTVPASNEALIKSLTVVNNDTVARSFQLFVNGTGAANALTPTVWLDPGSVAVYEDGFGFTVMDADGEVRDVFGQNPDAWEQFVQSGDLAETIPRWTLTETNTAALSSGRLSVQRIWLPAGLIISKINFWSGTTAAGTPTNQLFGLYSDNNRWPGANENTRQLLAVTVNDTTTAWAANTLKSLALATPARLTTPYSGGYWLAIMVTATTVPTLKGHTAPTAITGPRANVGEAGAGTGATGLTTTLPAALSMLTVTSTPIWGSVS